MWLPSVPLAAEAKAGAVNNGRRITLLPCDQRGHSLFNPAKPEALLSRDQRERL